MIEFQLQEVIASITLQPLTYNFKHPLYSSLQQKTITFPVIW